MCLISQDGRRSITFRQRNVFKKCEYSVVLSLNEDLIFSFGNCTVFALTTQRLRVLRIDLERFKTLSSYRLFIQ